MFSAPPRMLPITPNGVRLRATMPTNHLKQVIKASDVKSETTDTATNTHMYAYSNALPNNVKLWAQRGVDRMMTAFSS